LCFVTRKLSVSLCVFVRRFQVHTLQRAQTFSSMAWFTHNVLDVPFTGRLTGCSAQETPFVSCAASGLAACSCPICKHFERRADDPE
jgi:hypothetical protein